jgi:hypothetical protein
VDQGTSRNLNLTYASDDTFILRADYKTRLDPSGPGRNSVRIKSHKTFTQHVAVYVNPYVALLRRAQFLRNIDSMCDTCLKAAGEFPHFWLVALCAHLRGRTWPAVWEVAPNSWPQGVSDFQTRII